MIDVPPEREKWERTLQLLRRAIVISEITISRNTEKVEKTANLTCATDPKPAAAEKLPRSMIPDGMNTSECFLWMTLRPVEPSRSPLLITIKAYKSNKKNKKQLFWVKFTVTLGRTVLRLKHCRNPYRTGNGTNWKLLSSYQWLQVGLQ